MIVVPLTIRETDVLRLLAQHCSNEEIAADLVLSLNTVKTHMRSLFQKLSVSRRATPSAEGGRSASVKRDHSALRTCWAPRYLQIVRSPRSGATCGRPKSTAGQASAAALSRSNSVCVIVPWSSRFFAVAIWSAGLLRPATS